MVFYWVKTNRFIKKLFPKYVWDIANDEKKVYLTFDDGPTPEVTKWTLDQLRKHNVKATFFCIGNNIRQYPEIFARLQNEGHAIGNHTFNHLNGWKTMNAEYLSNIEQCGSVIREFTGVDTDLFRPPYGKVKKSQAAALLKMGYKIIMWDVLSADFDNGISPEKCLENVVKNVKSGSVIIFHDSVKGYKNLEYTLPRTLAFLKEKGFKCEVIR
jgi:peptidoglycan-N-acetylglucosamine deacetylase